MSTKEIIHTQSDNQDMILSVINLNEEELFWMKFEVAEQFLLDQTNRDVWSTKELLNSKEPFWPWFHNQWNITNAKLIQNSGIKLRYESMQSAKEWPDFEWQHGMKVRYKDYQLDAFLSPHINGSYGDMIASYIKNNKRTDHVKAIKKSV